MGILSVIGLFAGKIFSNVYVIIGIVVAAVIAAFVAYFLWSQSHLASLQAEIGTARQQLTQQQAVITDMQVQNKKVTELTTQYNANVQEIRNRNNELAKLFAKIELSKLAAKDPSAVEKKVNESTKKFFDDVEAISKQ
jgi:Tfp pilus assembly protein PilO